MMKTKKSPFTPPLYVGVKQELTLGESGQTMCAIPAEPLPPAKAAAALRAEMPHCVALADLLERPLPRVIVLVQESEAALEQSLRCLTTALDLSCDAPLEVCYPAPDVAAPEAKQERFETVAFTAAGLLPVITALDLEAAENTGWPGALEGCLSYRMRERASKTRPYWQCLHTHPLAVVAQLGSGAVDPFADTPRGTPEVTPNFLLEQVDKMQFHKTLILCIVDPSLEHSGAGQAPLGPFYQEARFALGAEILVLPPPAAWSPYYQNMLRAMLGQAKLRIAPDVDLENALTTLYQVRRGSISGWQGARTVEQFASLLAATCRDGPVTASAIDALLLPFRETPAAPAENAPAPETLYGLDDVRRQLESVVDGLRLQTRRRKLGLPQGGAHNVLAMIGAPGTGKTTAAHLLYKRLCEEGLLNACSDALCVVSGGELKAPYVGHTVPRIRKMFEENAMIFIDEAYALAEDGAEGRENDHFAQEALAQLCIELERLDPHQIVVFAGYGDGTTNRMRQFLHANPGLASRIGTTLYFAPYSPDADLPGILGLQAARRGETLAHGWQALCIPYFRRRAAAEDYGNGREARRLLDACELQLASRTATLPAPTAAELTEILPEDITHAIATLEGGLSALNRISRRTVGFR